MVYFAHSLTSPELVMEFVEEYEGYFYYRIYCDSNHPIFLGAFDLSAHRVSYAILYHKEKGFRFMEESERFKRGYEVGPDLFYMIDFATAQQKCLDKTPAPGLFRSYTSDKYTSVARDISHTKKLLKTNPRININSDGKKSAIPLHNPYAYQFYNNLVVTPVATHYHSPMLDIGSDPVEIGKRKRVADELTGLQYFPGNYASTAEYFIQCGDHTISVTYSNGHFY